MAVIAEELYDICRFPKLGIKEGQDFCTDFCIRCKLAGYTGTISIILAALCMIGNTMNSIEYTDFVGGYTQKYLSVRF